MLTRDEMSSDVRILSVVQIRRKIRTFCRTGFQFRRDRNGCHDGSGDGSGDPSYKVACV